MLGSPVLDVAIGLVFVYLLLSTLVSVINEWIAQLAALRAKTLETGIKNLLNDPHAQGFAADVFQHALVQGLGRRASIASALHKPGKPSYIPARVFSRALIDGVMTRAAAAAPGVTAGAVDAADVLAMAGSPPNGVSLPTTSRPTLSLQDVRDAVLKLNQYPDVQKSLLAMMDETQYSVQDLRRNIEAWFDDAMDRVSGWYKRLTQVIVLLIAIVVTVVVNADSIAIGNALWTSPSTRAAVASAAEQYAQKSPPTSGDFQRRVTDLQTNLNGLQLPLGWPSPMQLPGTLQDWAMAVATKLPGWLLTILAVSLGAPFWFDLLNKFMTFRASGKPPTTGGSAG
jgi:hypothetical protein